MGRSGEWLYERGLNYSRINIFDETAGIVNNEQALEYLLSEFPVLKNFTRLSDAAIGNMKNQIIFTNETLKNAEIIQNGMIKEFEKKLSPKDVIQMKTIFGEKLFSDFGNLMERQTTPSKNLKQYLFRMRYLGNDLIFHVSTLALVPKHASIDVTRNDCYVDGLICSTEKASGRRLDGIRVGTGCFGDSGGPLMVQRGKIRFLRQCECGCQYKNSFVDVRKHM